jgi:hypothetical protein
VVRPCPSLENLRKQAKLILRWHRERYNPVAAQIRMALPRIRNLSDAEVLDHSFKLDELHGTSPTIWRIGVPFAALRSNRSTRSA